MERITFESSAYKDLVGEIDQITEYSVKKDSGIFNPEYKIWQEVILKDQSNPNYFIIGLIS